jgi:glycosyltransferase involved in cell wall biosynthesis
MVTLEALACGTPVIVSNLTAVPEPVTDNVGVIVKNYKPEAFLEAIYEFDFNDKFESCLERAKFFDKNITYQKYIDEYEDLLS